MLGEYLTLFHSLTVPPDDGRPKDEHGKEGESPKPPEEAERREEVSNIHVRAGIREVRLTLHSADSGKLADVRVKGNRCVCLEFIRSSSDGC